MRKRVVSPWIFGYTTISLVLIAVAALFTYKTNAYETSEAVKPQVIQLTKENSVTVRGVITAESITKLQLEVFDKASRMGESDTLYLVLDTPGGSVDAGQAFIDTVRGLRPKVSTITLFAASMGFHIAESLGERLITPSGVLMSHRVAIGGLSGQVPGEAVTRINFIIKESLLLDAPIAKRMFLTLKEYEKKVYNEYWVTGADAVNESAADRVVLVSCTGDLIATTSQSSVSTIFGDISLTYSGCPLIRIPLSIGMGNISRNTRGYTKVSDFINELTQDKESFVEDFIVNGKFNQIIKR